MANCKFYEKILRTSSISTIAKVDGLNIRNSSGSTVGKVDIQNIHSSFGSIVCKIDGSNIRNASDSMVAKHLTSPKLLMMLDRVQHLLPCGSSFADKFSLLCQ
jgi:hypothetical protein